MIAYGSRTTVRSVRRGMTILFISIAMAKPRISSTTTVTSVMMSVVHMASQNSESLKAET